MFVFGGTFNPIHLGHLHIIHNVLCAFDAVKNDEKLLLVPSFIPPFKENDPCIMDFDKRLMLIKLAMDDYSTIYSKEEKKLIEVSLVEKEYNAKMFTSVLVEKLIKSGEEIPIKFIAGDDILPSLNMWNDVEYLKKNVKFIIYPRCEKNNFHRKKDGFDIEYLKGSIFNASSTAILKYGRFDLLTDSCRRYIEDNPQYLHCK